MKTNTKKIAGIGLFTAIVVVLQLLGSFIHFGVFSISLVLAPIIVGTALYGVGAGAWLGLVFGVTVLATDAGAFLAIDPAGTVVTVLVKGVCAGVGAGLVFKLIEKKSRLGATIAAGIASPVCNTGVFLIGCRLFFFPTIKEWTYAAANAELVKTMTPEEVTKAAAESVTATQAITFLVGANFFVELAINLVLATVIVKIIEIGQKSLNSKKSVQLEDSVETE
ncbi:MAG: ECF transporter S component [Eubacterium sp.]